MPTERATTLSLWYCDMREASFSKYVDFAVSLSVACFPHASPVQQAFTSHHSVLHPRLLPLYVLFRPWARGVKRLTHSSPVLASRAHESASWAFSLCKRSERFDRRRKHAVRFRKGAHHEQDS